jgi:hypothetical protein
VCLLPERCRAIQPCDDAEREVRQLPAEECLDTRDTVLHHVVRLGAAGTACLLRNRSGRLPALALAHFRHIRLGQGRGGTGLLLAVFPPKG